MKALEHRKEVKAKKPRFRRHDSHKKLKLAASWRRPKGLHNKVRLRKRGYVRHTEIGWGSPKEVKDLHPSGLEQVRVIKIADLANIDPKTQGIIISSTISDRNKIVLIEEAKKKNIKILNFDTQNYLVKIRMKLDQRKKERETKAAKKKAAKKEAEKVAKKVEEKKKEEKKEQEKKTEDDKKLEKKKETDKLLTKKGSQ